MTECRPGEPGPDYAHQCAGLCLPRNPLWLTTHDTVALRVGDPRFLDLLDEIEQLHAEKQQDYGTNADSFANVRASEALGIPGWIGCLIRMNDKMRRLNKAAAQVINGQPVSMAFDGPRDDFRDLMVYSGIGVILFEEQTD